MPFTFEKLNNGAILITPKIFYDNRGFFLETFQKNDFQDHGIPGDFYQDNHSFSIKNVLRGIHFQNNPKPQGKLVRCIKGAIWDVAVDLRKSSSTFTKWVGIELTEKNKKMLYIPEGFGHGFITLSDEAEIIYKCTNNYIPSLDCGIIWNDPTLSINWNIKDPIISEKDKKLDTLEELLNCKQSKIF